ncbi:NUDIX domain-containing protein [Hymenobacter sp. RP-2-7]|uniref:NUDIX domain-containing protein n=2 Tax=Hymenobacter polaris TaxID=2682546 RepID=A0A7Y0AIG6_9BACT|nr:NUDIX domain-containing protein [Hymenobacter polaris]
MSVIDKLAWLEIQDNRILLTKSYGKDKFYIPGGKRESEETDEQALIREIQEELTVLIDKSTLQFIGIFEAQAHGQPEGILVQMTCYTGCYQGQLKASAEIEEITWFSYADKDQVVGVDKLIFDHLKQQGLLF